MPNEKSSGYFRIQVLRRKDEVYRFIRPGNFAKQRWTCTFKVVSTNKMACQKKKKKMEKVKLKKNENEKNTSLTLLFFNQL